MDEKKHDPGPYQNVTDPQHCLARVLEWYGGLEWEDGWEEKSN